MKILNLGCSPELAYTWYLYDYTHRVFFIVEFLSNINEVINPILSEIEGDLLGEGNYIPF